MYHLSRKIALIFGFFLLLSSCSKEEIRKSDVASDMPVWVGSSSIDKKSPSSFHAKSASSREDSAITDPNDDEDGNGRK